MDNLGPRTPGIVVSLLCCAAAVLLGPDILARFFSLDWKIGNLRPLAYSLQAMFGLLTVLSLAAQKAINRLYRKVFPTGKKLLFSVFAIVLSVCFSLLALELVLRLLHLPFTERRSVTENRLAQFDPELGWTYIPNLSIVQRFGSDYRRVPIYFDSYGSRVRAPGVPRDPAAPSLLIVGCSFAFGQGLPYEETFAGRLESTPGFPLQVVNLAVQAYGTDQALLRLKREFKHFNTRVVVYVYIDDTDPRNDNDDRRLLLPGARFLGTKPLFALRDDGTLYLRHGAVRYEDLSYSRVWALVRLIYTRRGPRPSHELTRALVKDMQDYVESNGAILIVVYWSQESRPADFEVSPFPGMGLNLINTRQNAPPGWGEWTIRGDGHPDARANARVAELLLEALHRVGYGPS